MENFWLTEDFEVVSVQCWQWFGKDVAIIMVWELDADLEEDPLDSIP